MKNDNVLTDVQQVKEEGFLGFWRKTGHELPERKGEKILDEENAWAKVVG